MTDPKMMYAQETLDSMAEGCEMMVDLVRGSVFTDEPEMPPAPIWAWYAKNVALRFISHEYRMIYNPDEEVEIDYHQTREELKAVLVLLAKTQQFGLQADIQKMLNTRKLHLPTGYVPEV